MTAVSGNSWFDQQYDHNLKQNHQRVSQAGQARRTYADGLPSYSGGGFDGSFNRHYHYGAVNHTGYGGNVVPNFSGGPGSVQFAQQFTTWLNAAADDAAKASPYVDKNRRSAQQAAQASSGGLISRTGNASLDLLGTMGVVGGTALGVRSLAGNHRKDSWDMSKSLATFRRAYSKAPFSRGNLTTENAKAAQAALNKLGWKGKVFGFTAFHMWGLSAKFSRFGKKVRAVASGMANAALSPEKVNAIKGTIFSVAAYSAKKGAGPWLVRAAGAVLGIGSGPIGWAVLGASIAWLTVPSFFSGDTPKQQQQ